MALMDLFRPRWKNSNPEVRKAAVDSLVDQGALAKIAMTDTEDSVRVAAIKKLTDGRLLALIADHDCDMDARAAAEDNLGHQAPLAGEPVRRVAPAARLADQAILAESAKNDNDASVRATAARRELATIRFRSVTVTRRETQWMGTHSIIKSSLNLTGVLEHEIQRGSVGKRESLYVLLGLAGGLVLNLLLGHAYLRTPLRLEFYFFPVVGFFLGLMAPNPELDVMYSTAHRERRARGLRERCVIVRESDWDDFISRHR